MVGLAASANAQDLTAEQFEARALKHMMKNDANGDGKLSKEEFAASRKNMEADKVEKAFKRLDSDGDGQLSAAEAGVTAQQRFKKLDADGDGKLTQAERSKE